MRSNSIEERAVELAQYIIDSKDTVRGAAKKFGISKSTVHTDVDELQFLGFSKNIELERKIGQPFSIKICFSIKM